MQNQLLTLKPITVKLLKEEHLKSIFIYFHKLKPETSFVSVPELKFWYFSQLGSRMGKTRNPRFGSLQFWPRRRASRLHPSVHKNTLPKGKGLFGFAAYKAGMTHIIAIDNRPTTLTKGEEISIPVTILESPALKAIGIRVYAKNGQFTKVISEFLVKGDKELNMKRRFPKAPKAPVLAENATEVRLLVATQPKKIDLKKTPEIFEMDLLGNLNEQFDYAKSVLGKEISQTDALKEGEQYDIFAVTKGKGFQGPVKRFGVSLRAHKSEKGRRGPANVGSWTGARQWTVAKAGQMGTHTRMDRNKWLIKMGSAKDVNPNGGFVNYGLIKESYIMLKGSLPGPKKRLIRLVPSDRPNNLPKTAPTIESISLQSKQGA